MERYLIIVEGKADIIFIKDYLIFLDSSLELKEDNRKKQQYLSIASSSKIIKIFYSGGYTKIKPSKTRIEKLQMDNGIKETYKILVIQDADDPTKDDGGVVNRIEYLNNINIEFQTFLFPNDEDDGDLETLLIKIVKHENYDKSFICYENYVNCVKKISEEKFANELLEDKNRVFNYFRTYYGMEDSKEENRKYILDYWDFKSDALKPLKKFLLLELQNVSDDEV
ncbi:MAG: hypothetical protein Q9M36_02185 [Sulfurovum sp.]|nr:hypothetical protein [Sulfurovum sp.]